MANRRRVRLDRDGNFTIAGHRYCLRRGTSILTEGQWECWDEDLPDVDTTTTLTEAEALRRRRPLWVENTQAEARDRIDRADENGHF